MSETRAKERVKAMRKLKRKQQLLLKQEPHLPAYFTTETTEHLFVANGGKVNGINRELLFVLCDGLAKNITMLEDKDYCFVTCTDRQASLSLVEKLNGISVQEECERRGILHMLGPCVAAGLPLRLYVGYVTSIPDNVTFEYLSPISLPPGLILKPEYITNEEEQMLLTFFKFGRIETRDHYSSQLVGNPVTEAGSRCKPTSEEEGITNDCSAETSYRPPETTLKLRKVKHYGYEFIYGSNTVDIQKPLPCGLPAVCAPLLRRIVNDGLVCSTPDQLTVNEYLPGAGIPPHIDTHSAFEDGIISVSLSSHTVMDFTAPDRHKVSVFVPPRSLLIMKGESRYLWSHGIVARKFDSVYPNMVGYSSHGSAKYSEAGTTSGDDIHGSSDASNTVLHRGVRISLTFRKVRSKPCDCSYPSQCT